MKKNQKGKVLGLLCLLLCLLMAAPMVNAQAASKKSKALKAYSKFLAKAGSGGSMALAYIDRDSVPELVYLNSVYTWKNGKMEKIWNGTGIPTWYYKKKGVFIAGYSIQDLTDIEYYEVKGGQCQKFMSEYWYRNNRKASKGRADGRALLRKDVKRILKKYVGSKKETEFKFYKNTAANRRKYLK